LEGKLKKEDLEILVSTMNRNTLDFLIPMFPFSHFSEFSILVINQTDGVDLLISEFPSVRVINFFEKGLSRSRNLALKNTIGKIVLIADDDVVFLLDFLENIINAYNINHTASAICFQTITNEGTLYSNYPKISKQLSKYSIKKVLSIEVSCKVEDLAINNCWYNELFGLGGKFQDSETFFFLRNMKYKELNIVFMPVSVVMHESFSSSDEADSDRVLYARMAGFYKRFSLLSYLLLLKYMFFLIRKYNFSLVEIKNKFFVGLSGIQDYQSILNNKLDSRYE
jgi:glycosyltransferase involved in cell wall biosynthesis